MRPDDLAQAPALFAAIPSLPRHELSRLTAAMIDLMDRMDGDVDLEMNGDELDGSLGEDDFHHQNADWLGYAGDPDDAEDDDPPGGSADDVGEVDDSRPDGIVLDRPRYGVDQSAGPINEAEAWRNFRNAQLTAPPPLSQPRM